MRIIRRSAAAVVALAAFAAPAAAQNTECAGYGTSNARNVCNAAIDGTRYFHPVAGILVSGGNPVIGSAAALGGLGHFSLSLRANAVSVVLPDLDYDGSSGTVQSGDTIFAPAPQIDGAIGLWGGLPGGLLAVDLLGAAQLLPTDQIDNFRLDQDATTVGGLGLGVGFGARIGILSGAGPLPGVSLSIMRRNIPTIQYGTVSATDPTGDDYAYAVDLHATNLRLTAGKKIAAFAVAAGLGWDRYTGDARVDFRDPSGVVPSVETVDFGLKQSRGVGFLNAGFDLPIVKIMGELGYQTGKDQNLTTNFEDVDTSGGKMFGGVGLRFAF
jgi:hypothetical protein